MASLSRVMACWVILILAQAAAAQDWARDMFDHTSHDFGVVARGAKVEHIFTMENIYVEDAHIADIRSTCGCTTPEADRRYLKTWEKAQIKATIDTRNFHGRKDATITVVLDKPFPAEVQLQVHCYIRSDVVVTPGAVQFGTVAQGQPAARRLAVAYAGRSDWRITAVETTNPHLAVEVAESPQSARHLGQVAYDLTVTLKADAPPGYLRDQVTLVTNDFSAQASRVPVAVEGVVVSALSVRPSPLLLPVIELGRETTRQLVVQGKSPFHVKSVRCDDARFRFKIPEAAQNLQLIPVTFMAEGAPGKVTGVIRIETDLDGRALEVPVQVQIIAPAGGGPTPGTPASSLPATTAPPVNSPAIPPPATDVPSTTTPAANAPSASAPPTGPATAARFGP